MRGSAWDILGIVWDLLGSVWDLLGNGAGSESPSEVHKYGHMTTGRSVET